MLRDARPRTILARGAFGFLVRALFLVAVLFLLTLAGVLAHAVWYGEFHPELTPAGTIIVLGGTMSSNGSLGLDTKDRALAGIRLYKAGLAPHIHFTGGVAAQGQPGPGTQMKELALSMGVPASAITVEDLSESTLQNAMFSMPILGDLAHGPVILVSNGYHLGRSWATFRWAGYDGPIQLYAPATFGRLPESSQAWRVFREALAWYYNPVRLVLWYAQGWMGVPDAQRNRILD